MPNLISPTAWVTGGPGTVTTGTTLVISGTGTGTTYARQRVATVAGATYWLTFEALTSTVLPGRLVGTTEGGGQIVASATASAWSNRIEFTATGADTWVQLQRQNTGECRVNAVSVERVSVANRPARRTNGINQYFQLNALSLGLRTANHNWCVGGWIRFDTATTAGTYLADFGRTDPAGTGGGDGRVRLVASTGTDARVFVSTALSDGSAYRECAHTTSVQVGAWHYVAAIAGTGGDVQLIWNGEYVGTRTGTVPSLQADSVCRELRFGAKVASPAVSHAPVSFSDWIWCSDFVPTAAQFTALASGTRPNELSGFAPTYHWPMAVDGGAETPLIGTQSLTASSSPRLAVGPTFGVVPDPDPPAAQPLDIIVV